LIKHIKQTLKVTDYALAGNRRFTHMTAIEPQATIAGSIC
jgi:hypothetical protein